MLLLSLLSGCKPQASDAAVTVSVAASLEPMVTQLKPQVESALGLTLLINAGASGPLARQIESGAAVDLFISADPVWVDYLVDRHHAQAASRRLWLTNRLALIAPPGQSPPADLHALLDPVWSRLALGDPAYVPAGRYATQALEHAGVRLADRIVPAVDVRAAMAMVLSGSCEAGIVYASDAMEAGLPFTLIPAEGHDPIRYEAVLTARGGAAALRVLDWLTTSSIAAEAARRRGWDIP